MPCTSRNKTRNEYSNPWTRGTQELSLNQEWDETYQYHPSPRLPVPPGIALQAYRDVWGGGCLLSSQSSGNLSSPFPSRKLHSGMKTYGCELCGKRFLDSLRLRMHLLAHSGRQGLLQRPHVGTDNHLLPCSPSELALSLVVFPTNQGFGPPCPLYPPSSSMEQKSHPECVPIRGT